MLPGASGINSVAHPGYRLKGTELKCVGNQTKRYPVFIKCSIPKGPLCIYNTPSSILQWYMYCLDHTCRPRIGGDPLEPLHDLFKIRYHISLEQDDVNCGHGRFWLVQQKAHDGIDHGIGHLRSGQISGSYKRGEKT